jgi:Cu+-exporting ATPase
MALAKDPVCGMNVDPDLAHTRRTEYKGKTYYFCSPDCEKAFDKEPHKYASPSEAG